MLRTRLISAVILIPLVVYGVLYLSTNTFMLILAFVLLAGMWEWGRLALLPNAATRVIYLAGIAGLFGLCLAVGLESIAWPVLLLACVWWLARLPAHSRACMRCRLSCIVPTLRRRVAQLVRAPP